MQKHACSLGGQLANSMACYFMIELFIKRAPQELLHACSRQRPSEPSWSDDCCHAEWDIKS